MKHPKIGDTITPEMGEKLCIHFGLMLEHQRLANNHHKYKDFKFDGASGVPTWVENLIPDFTKRALIHDLRYAYGIPGDWSNKWQADTDFAIGLLSDLKQRMPDGDIPYMVAKTALLAVIAAGDIPGTGFQWGFAEKKDEEL